MESTGVVDLDPNLVLSETYDAVFEFTKLSKSTTSTDYSVNRTAGSEEKETGALDCVWLIHTLPVPWERQIGPSCGLAALRMAYAAFLARQTQEKPQQDVEEVTEQIESTSIKGEFVVVLGPQ